MTRSPMPAGPDAWHMLDPSSMSVVLVLVLNLALASVGDLPPGQLLMSVAAHLALSFALSPLRRCRVCLLRIPTMTSILQGTPPPSSSSHSPHKPQAPRDDCANTTTTTASAAIAAAAATGRCRDRWCLQTWFLPFSRSVGLAVERVSATPARSIALPARRQGCLFRATSTSIVLAPSR